MSKNLKKDIFFCTDSNYIQFIPAAIESIERFDKNIYQYHIITDTDINEKTNAYFCELINSKKLTVHYIKKEEYAGLYERAHFTQAMYYRLSIPEMTEADTALYLDCDVLVRGKIGRLFDIDLKDNFVAAVINPFMSRSDIVEQSDYFNSGVMVLNLKKWRASDVKSKVLSIVIKENARLKMPDQDALNIVFNGNWHRLPVKYNAQTSMFSAYRDLGKEEKAGVSKPVIVHFSTSNKPWHKSCGLSYAREYQKLSTAILVPKRNFFIDVAIKWLTKLRYGVLHINRFYW